MRERRSTRIGAWIVAAALAGCDDGGAGPRADLEGAAPDGAVPVDAIIDAALSADAASPDAARPPVDAAAAPDAAPDGAADAEPLLADQNAYGPAGRITRLDVPATPADARAAGCLVHGGKVGTGLAQLLLLAGGGLRRFVAPDARGRIGLVIALRAEGWPAGAAAGTVARIDLGMLEGTQDAALELLYLPRAFRDDDPAGTPRTYFPDTLLDDGWLDTEPGVVELPVPLLEGAPIALGLEHARIHGRLAADGPGLRVDHGVLTGYLTAARARQLIDDIRTICLSPEPPGICNLFAEQIRQPPEELLALIVGLVGGLDVTFESGVPRTCDPAQETCDALSACFTFEARGVTIAGVAPADAGGSP